MVGVALIEKCVGEYPYQLEGLAANPSEDDVLCTRSGIVLSDRYAEVEMVVAQNVQNLVLVRPSVLWGSTTTSGDCGA